jgi:predicted acyl esterase
VEDLARATEAARSAIEPVVRRLETDGISVKTLRPCQAEARDGTRLASCVKHYIPQPDGRWGAVFSIDMKAERPMLLLLAVGERHPERPWKRSVYEIAHRRLHV